MFRGGGVQECVLAMQEELSRRGHEVKIITPKPRDYSGVIPDFMITVGASANVKAMSTSSQVSTTVDSELVDEILEREQFDILHFHEPWAPMLSRQLLSRSQSVNVATFHAKLPDNFTSKTIMNVATPYTRSVLKYIHAFTAVSDAAAEHVLSLANVPINIIPNGINLKKYQHKRHENQDNSKKTILYIGRLEKRKGINYLLKAFEQLQQHHPDVQLDIVGTGPDEQKLRDEVEELELKHVRFLGYLDDSDKIRCLQQADLFCSPARYGESFGIVLLEAMAAGVPLVAGDNPGYVSVMKGRGTLSIVDPKNTNEFARKLELFLTDEELRKIWRKWAKEYVQAFDYKRVIDTYEVLYERTLKSHGR